jgi:hypothetical protein
MTPAALSALLDLALKDQTPSAVLLFENQAILHLEILRGSRL